MKSDNFLTLGIVFDRQMEIGKIEKTHEFLNKNYNYFEILILTTENDAEFLSVLLKKLNNIRVMILSNYADIELANSIIIENCIGQYCAIFNPLEESLEDLASILEKCQDYDIIIGKRQKKIQNIFEKITSTIFYKAVSLFTAINLNSYYSNFFVINRKVINFISKNQERVKFVRLLALNNNFTKFEYLYEPQAKNSYKRSFIQNINFTIDLIITYSHKLIRMATLLALFASLINLFYIFYILIIFVFKKNIAQGWLSSSMYASSMNFALFMILAIFGEYIRIIILNQKNSPLYEISDEKSSVALIIKEKNVDKDDE